MSKVIATKFKELIQKSPYSYERFASLANVGTKQALSQALSKREDSNWSYEDIKKFCNVLNISHTMFLEDVERAKRYIN